MTKSLPASRTDAPLAPWQAVLILLAVCLVAWVVVLGVVLLTLVVAGSVGLVLLVVAVAAVVRGAR